MASGGCGERTQFSLRGWPLGVGPWCREYMDNKKMDFFLSSFFLRGSHSGGGMDLGGLGSGCDQGALCEIPK